jgi:acyl carrier protein
MTQPAQQAEKDVALVVREIIAEALARDVSEVQLQANLMEDLGAESLDFLDIVFKLERAFGIQITRGEMERAARGDMTDEEFAPGGVISEAGLAGCVNCCPRPPSASSRACARCRSSRCSRYRRS